MGYQETVKTFTETRNALAISIREKFNHSFDDEITSFQDLTNINLWHLDGLNNTISLRDGCDTANQQITAIITDSIQQMNELQKAIQMEANDDLGEKIKDGLIRIADKMDDGTARLDLKQSHTDTFTEKPENHPKNIPYNRKEQCKSHVEKLLEQELRQLLDAANPIATVRSV